MAADTCEYGIGQLTVLTLFLFMKEKSSEKLENFPQLVGQFYLSLLSCSIIFCSEFCKR